MGEKRKHVYEALVDGATEGLSGKALYEFVLKRCPKTSSKKIVRASLLALTDPHLKDRNILDTIYALAIKHRLDEVDVTDDHDDDDTREIVPVAKPRRKRAASPPDQDAASGGSQTVKGSARAVAPDPAP